MKKQWTMRLLAVMAALTLFATACGDGETAAGTGDCDSVDEVSLQPVRAGTDELQLHVAVGDRRYYATALQRLTGLDVGEGQARILLGDLQAYRGQLSREAGHDVDERTAGQLWVMEVATPMMHRAHAAVGNSGSALRAQ